jgi:hypothetical protein
MSRSNSSFRSLLAKGIPSSTANARSSVAYQYPLSNSVSVRDFDNRALTSDTLAETDPIIHAAERAELPVTHPSGEQLAGLTVAVAWSVAAVLVAWWLVHRRDA